MENQTKQATFQTKTDQQHLIFGMIIKLINFTKKSSNNALTIRTSQFLKLLIVFHTIGGYLILSAGQTAHSLRQIIKTIQTQSHFYYYLYQVSTYMVNAIIILSFFLSSRLQSKFWSTYFQKIVPLYTVFTRFSILSTSFLLYLNFYQNLIAMVLAIAALLLDDLLFHNYVIKRSLNFKTSQSTSIYLEIIISAHLITNSFFVHRNSPFLFYLSSASFAFVLFIWFLMYGYKLYIHKTSKLANQAYCSLQMSIGFISLLFVIQGDAKGGFNIFTLALFILIIFGFLKCWQRHKINSYFSYQYQPKNLKELQLNLTAFGQHSQQMDEDKILLIGILNEEMNRLNNNWFRQPLLYDPLLKRYINPTNIRHERDSLIKFYLKFLYENALICNDNPDLMIDYCQFMVSQFGDFSTHCYYLQKLTNDTSLGLFQKIKVWKLKLMLQQQCISFNKLIFGGKIELLSVFKAEKTMQSIMENIDKYCFGNMQVWAHFKGRQIDLHNLKQKIESNITILQVLQSKWKLMFEFLGINKRWKVIYLHYLLFLKNQKLKSKEIQFSLRDDNQFASTVRQLKQKITQRLPLKQINLLVLQRNSGIIITVMENQQLIFLNISRAFQSLAGYSVQQIKGVPLSIILPNPLKLTHDTLIKQWIENGRTTSQEDYKIKYSSFINKDQQQSPCIVIYKLYIDFITPDSILKFCALIRQNLDKNTFEQSQQKIPSRKRHKSKMSTREGVAPSLRNKHKKILDNSDNLFIKEEYHQPAQTMRSLLRIKLITRLNILIVMLLILVLTLTVHQTSNQIEQTSQKWVNLLNLYRYPMNLIKNYMKIMLGLGNKSSVQSVIAAGTAVVLQIKTNIMSLQTIYDQNLNKPGFFPAFKTKQSTINEVYDQYDIFQIIFSSIITLSNSPTINRTNQQFALLNSYLKPSYDQMINQTKIEFHYLIQNQINSQKIHQIIIIVLLIASSLAIAIYICFKIYKYCQQMKEVLYIIIKFETFRINKLIQYWSNTKNIFEKLHHQIKTVSAIKNYSQRTYSIQLLEENNENATLSQDSDRSKKVTMNQKQKQIILTQQQEKRSIKLAVIFFVIIMGSTLCLLFLPIYNLNTLQNLHQFQNDGFTLFRYYPTTTILGFAISDRYYNQIYPNQTTFYPSRFQDIISNLKLMGQINYMAQTVTNSLYSEKMKNYFFKNPCLYNPAVLTTASSTVQKCLAYANSTLSNGISTYLHYVTPFVDDYLHFRTNYTTKDMDDLISGMAVVGYYIADAIYTWGDDLTTMINSFSINCKFLSILLCCLIIFLYLFVIEYTYLPLLQDQFKFTRTVFLIMVPQNILNEEKIVKHQFHQTGILGLP